MNNLEKIFLKNIDLCVRQYEKEIQKKRVIHGMRKAIQMESIGLVNGVHPVLVSEDTWLAANE